MNTTGTKCKIYPSMLNSCIVSNACKKIKIMKIKVKLNVYVTKDIGLPPNQGLCLLSLARHHEAHGSSKVISSMNFTESPSLKRFNLCPFTLKILLVDKLWISKAPWGWTLFTTKGPSHLDLSLPGKSLNLELNSRTFSPIRNSFLDNLATWNALPLLTLVGHRVVIGI